MSRLFLSDERKWMTCLKKERTARAEYYALEKANERTASINIVMRMLTVSVRPYMTGI
jgi:hypothetical protein